MRPALTLGDRRKTASWRRMHARVRARCCPMLKNCASSARARQLAGWTQRRHGSHTQNAPSLCPSLSHRRQVCRLYRSPTRRNRIPERPVSSTAPTFPRQVYAHTALLSAYTRVLTVRDVWCEWQRKDTPSETTRFSCPDCKAAFREWSSCRSHIVFSSSCLRTEKKQWRSMEALEALESRCREDVSEVHSEDERSQQTHTKCVGEENAEEVTAGGTGRGGESGGPRLEDEIAREEGRRQIEEECARRVGRRASTEQGDTHRCPDCKATFESWDMCRSHIVFTGCMQKEKQTASTLEALEALEERCVIDREEAGLVDGIGGRDAIKFVMPVFGRGGWGGMGGAEDRCEACAQVARSQWRGGSKAMCSTCQERERERNEKANAPCYRCPECGERISAVALIALIQARPLAPPTPRALLPASSACAHSILGCPNCYKQIVAILFV